MWNINEAFVDQQVYLGKTFYSSHPINNVEGALRDELRYLKTMFKITVEQINF